MTFHIGCALTFLLTVAGTAVGAPQDKLSAQDIVDLAIERAEWKDSKNFEASFSFRMVNESEKLDKKGRVKEREERVYENQPIDGAPFMRLVEKNGRPLTEKELKKERKREEKYRQRLADKSKPHDEGRIAFDEKLVSRYKVQLQGMEDIRGRPAYIISFEPKSGPFPTKKRMDRTLSKSAGRLWIDAENYEIAQLEFELIDEVKLGWGLIGSIKQLRGRLQQEPVDGYPDVWLPSRFDIYMNGRISFKTLNRNEKMEWSDFRKLPEQEQQADATSVPYAFSGRSGLPIHIRVLTDAS